MAKDKRVETVTWDDDVWEGVDETPAPLTAAREPAPAPVQPTPPKPEEIRTAPPQAAATNFLPFEPTLPKPEPVKLAPVPPPAVPLVKTPAARLPEANKPQATLPPAVPGVPKAQPPPMPIVRKTAEEIAPKVEQPPPLPKTVTLPAKGVAAPPAPTKIPVQSVPSPEKTTPAKIPAASPPPNKLPPQRTRIASIFTRGATEETPVAEENAPPAPKPTVVKHPKLGPAFSQPPANREEKDD